MAVGPIVGGLPLAQPNQVPSGEGTPLAPLAPLSEKDAPSSVSFGAMFGELVANANHQGHVAHAASVALAEGRSDDIHGTMIEGQKAAVQMKLVGTIKNKVVDAFYEIWRMNI